MPVSTSVRRAVAGRRGRSWCSRATRRRSPALVTTSRLAADLVERRLPAARRGSRSAPGGANGSSHTSTPTSSDSLKPVSAVVARRCTRTTTPVQVGHHDHRRGRVEGRAGQLLGGLELAAGVVLRGDVEELGRERRLRVGRRAARPRASTRAPGRACRPHLRRPAVQARRSTSRAAIRSSGSLASRSSPSPRPTASRPPRSRAAESLRSTIDEGVSSPPRSSSMPTSDSVKLRRKSSSLGVTCSSSLRALLDADRERQGQQRRRQRCRPGRLGAHAVRRRAHRGRSRSRTARRPGRSGRSRRRLKPSELPARRSGGRSAAPPTPGPAAAANVERERSGPARTPRPSPRPARRPGRGSSHDARAGADEWPESSRAGRSPGSRRRAR